MSSYLGRALVLFFVVLAISGCNSSGMAEKTFGTFMAEASSEQKEAVDTFMAEENLSFDEDQTLGEIYENASPEEQEEMEDLAGINTVHNPEPASIMLFGLGALGLLRRRKKNS